MFTVDDLVAEYNNYTDQELYNVYQSIEAYSPEAEQALAIIIEKRGGLDALKLRLEQELKMGMERNRIIKEVNEMGRKGIDESFIRTTVVSDILDRKEVSEIIAGAYREAQLDVEDRRINPRTIIGGIIGTALASTIGGVLWGLRLIYGPMEISMMIHAILLFGLLVICYGIINLCTRQSRKNIIVLIGTAVSFIFAFGLGVMLYNWIGAH